MGFEKAMGGGGGLTSVVQNYLTKGEQTSSMSSTNADLIAVSFAQPKDPKSLFRMGPPSQQCPKAHGESRRLPHET